MSDIAKRLSLIVDRYADGNEAKFAKDTGIHPATFHNYVHGRSPKVESLINIRKKYGININWLAMGEGEMTETIEPYGLPRPKPMPDKALNADSDFFMATIKALTSYADTLPDSELRDKVLNFISFLISEHTRAKKQGVEIEKKIAA